MIFFLLHSVSATTVEMLQLLVESADADKGLHAPDGKSLISDPFMDRARSWVGWGGGPRRILF